MSGGLCLLAIAVLSLANAVLGQEGTRRWAVNVQGFITLSSPALSPDGNTIYIGVERSSSGRVIALSAEGTKKWDIGLPEPVDASPAVGADGTVYIGCVDGFLYALSPANGATKWRFNARGFVTSSAAIADDGTIYVGSSARRLFAINPQDGTERWSFAAGDVIDSSPAIGSDGTIYFGSDDRNLYAVTPAGVERWRFSTGARIFASPAIAADGTVYIGSGDQRLYAISPDGSLKWSYFTNGDIQSSPVLGADGTVYFNSTDANFYALNPGGSEDLRLKWKSEIRTTGASTAAVRGDGAIIFGADDNQVRALSPIDGRVLWTFSGNGGSEDDIESSPVIAPDGSIYVGSTDGFLYKIVGNGSPLSKLSSWPAFRRDLSHTGRMPAAVPAGELANIATRAQAGGNNHLIAGFVVQGPSEKSYLVRAVGPGLAALGLDGFMRDPALDLFAGQVRLQSNDNWPLNDPVSGAGLIDTFQGVEAFSLAVGSKDAAMVRALGSGAFTASVTSADGGQGVALVEVYDARGGERSTRLLNLSTRGQVGSGEDLLIAGFVVRDGPMRLLLRGIGPALTQFGVSGALARPSLAVFDRNRVRVAGNTGWASDGYSHDILTAAAAVAAFSLPAGSADCALIFDAQPGDYTIQISGTATATGVALVEIYVLP